MSINNDLFTENVPDIVPELIESFSKLLLNASGDSKTLNKFQQMINSEIDRVSSLDSSSDMDDKCNDIDDQEPNHQLTSTPVNTNLTTLPNGFLVHHNRATKTHNPIMELDAPTSPQNSDKVSLVEHIPDLNLPEELYDDIMEVLNGLDLSDTTNSVQTKWLSPINEPYNYAKVTNNPVPICDFPPIIKLMAIVNEHPSTTHNMDCCLITRYSSATSSLGLHKDADNVTCQSSSICTVSFGAPRQLTCVFDGKVSPDGVVDLTPDIILPAVDQSMNVMKPGAQQVMKHAVRPGNTVTGLSNVRYSLSFRKIVPQTSNQVNTTDNGAQLGQHPPSPTVQHHGQEGSNAPNISSAHQCPQHLIIGDSLVKGMRVPGSISICRGGIGPGELLQLLPNSTDILHPDQYDDIRSVTVIVGTNALNVKRAGQGMDFLDVVEDYEKLIHDLKKLFPNARIGMYNVIPRAYTCMETVIRIQLFNNIFENHVVNRLKGVFWIKQYWEFLDDRGFLRTDLYGRLGIHLKGKGKGLMAKCIKNFQKSYN